MTQQSVFGRHGAGWLVASVLSVCGLLVSACGSSGSGSGAAGQTTAAAASATTAVAASPTTAAAGATATTAGAAATTAAAAATTAAASTPTGSPLKLAYMINATGPAPKGQNVDVAKAWVAYTNAHGGVAGHPVDLEIKDTKADAPTGQTFANELAKDPSVLGVMVLDPVGESTFIPTLVDQGLPVLGGVGSSQKVWGVLPNVFAVATTPKTVANGFVLAAQDAGAKGIGVAACAEAEACSAGVPLFQAEANKLGIKFTGVVKLDLNATSYTAECLQLMQNGTDFMLLAATAVAGIRLFNDCAQQGYKGNLGASVGAVTPDLYDGSPDIRLTGMIGAFPWWVDDAPVKQFRDVMQAGGVDAKKYGSPNGTATYTSLELFKKALESDSALPAEPTRADVLAAYGKLKDETLGGLLPKPLTFTPGQPGPDVNCFWFYKYADGQFSGSFKPACDPDS